METKHIIDWTALILMMIGALNWGLVAVNPTYNLVDLAFGRWPTVARVIYGLVGIAFLYELYYLYNKYGSK